VWAARRNRQQQVELKAKLEEAETQLDAQARGVQAFTEIVSRAAEVLKYIAVHGAHARARWSRRLEDPTRWGDLSDAQQEQYDDFVQLCAAQLAVATLDVQRLLVLRGEELDEEIGLMDQILQKGDHLVRTRA